MELSAAVIHTTIDLSAKYLVSYDPFALACTAGLSGGWLVETREGMTTNCCDYCNGMIRIVQSSLHSGPWTVSRSPTRQSSKGWIVGCVVVWL